MDSERRSLIVTAAVGLLVLAIIIGSIYYLVKFIQNRQSGQSTQVSSEQTQNPGGTASATLNPTVSSTPQGKEQGNTNPSNLKAYNGGNFQLSYPQTWGLLTCTNSQNIELDPTNGANSTVGCDRALKPVTIIAQDNLNCQGETVTLGGNQVIRISRGNKGGGEIDYRWCVINPNGVDLDITHRVSQDGSRATSKQDFAQDVEQMISRLKFSTGS